MAARLLADEHFPHSVAYRLRRLGHDVATVRDEGLAGTSDEALFQWCRERDYAILTFDHDDFRLLHLEHPGHAGVVACTPKPKDETNLHFARRIDDRIREHLRETGTLRGDILRITVPQ